MCIEQGSSTSHATAAKVLDVISRFRDCSGEASDAVSAYTQVKLEDASDEWEFTKSECPTIWISLPRSRCTTPCDKIQVLAMNTDIHWSDNPRTNSWRTLPILCTAKKLISLRIGRRRKKGKKEKKNEALMWEKQEKRRLCRAYSTGSGVLGMCTPKMQN